MQTPPASFGATIASARVALPTNSARFRVAADIESDPSTLLQYERGSLKPPTDVAFILRLAKRIQTNAHVLLSMAIRERREVRLDCKDPHHVKAATGLALVWAELTPEQAGQIERLALSMVKP